MKNRITKAGTNADSSTPDEVTTSAKLLPNPLLSDALSGNALIFIFDNWDIEPGMEKEENPFYNKGFNMVLCSEAKFNSSWDWLMPVYKKFSSLQGQPMPSFMIHFRNISAWVERVNIEEAYRCLVDAIKWYNQDGVSEGIR